jgi:hypothetical protein
MNQNMPLSENNYIETISGYSKSQWQPLLDLIPEIKAKLKFSIVPKIEQDKDGVIIVPPFSAAEVVGKFQYTFEELGLMISFDWGSWIEGREILEGKSFDFDAIDIPTKCKLISMIIRNDRFCNGYLVSTFESGLMLQVLESIERQLS